MHPGPTYATSCGQDRKSRPEIPWYDVAQHIADCANVDVDLLSGELNVDGADGSPVAKFSHSKQTPDSNTIHTEPRAARLFKTMSFAATR